VSSRSKSNQPTPSSSTSAVRLRPGALRRGRTSPASCCRRPRRKASWRQVSVGLAAAGVYAASLLTNQKVTQSQVSEVANISEVTIRNRYHELLEADQQDSVYRLTSLVSVSPSVRRYSKDGLEAEWRLRRFPLGELRFDEADLHDRRPG